MFAVIRTGGKQYKVAEDDIIAVEKLAGEPGEVVEFDEVLMIGDGAEVATGTPLVEGAAVRATLVEQSRAEKIIVFKKRRRHNYRRKNGHRQYQSVLHIDEIRAAAGSPLAAAQTSTTEERRAAEEEPAVEAEPLIEQEPTTEQEPAGEAGVGIAERPAEEEGISNGS